MHQLALVLPAISSVLNLTSLALIAGGVVLGIVFGALPGLSATTALAVLLPITFVMTPEQAVPFFMAIYVGSQFGNSIPAILLGIPGTPAAVITAYEGNVFLKLGREVKALMISLYASVIGQFMAWVGIVLLLFPLARVSIHFLFPEIFALGVMGLSITASISGRRLLKGLISAAIGVALMTVGPDPVTGRARFSFGNPYLQGGFSTVAVIIGLLIVSDIVYSLSHGQDIKFGKARGKVQILQNLPSWLDMRLVAVAILIGGVVGFFVGALPGAGASVATFVAYQQLRLVARKPELLGGKGSLEAIAVVDAANNASTGGEIIPTLALGIPGGPTTLLVLTGLIVQGVTPGPTLFRSAPHVISSAIGGLFVAQIFLAVLGVAAIVPTALLARLPAKTTRIAALFISITGVFALRWSMFDVYVALGVGFIGYLMYRFDYPVIPAALGVILGPIVEENLRRGLVMTYDNYWNFFTRPAVMGILGFALVTLIATSILSHREGSAHNDAQGGDDASTP